MAKPKTITPEAALAGIATIKAWSGPADIPWVETISQQWPRSFTARVPLSIQSQAREGLFIQISYKQSAIPEVRDRISFALMVDSARTLAIDDNGPSRHHNGESGAGLPYFRRSADHPHIHLPTQTESYGYAEPLPVANMEEHWRTFLDRANIVGAPPFRLPAGQQDLPL